MMTPKTSISSEWEISTFHARKVNARTHIGIVQPSCTSVAVESSWNVMALGDAREKKWRGNKRMEWVTSKRHMTAEHRLVRAAQTLQADAHTSAASSRLNWRPADLNGLVCFAERRNPVSARVPSHFQRSLLDYLAAEGPWVGWCEGSKLRTHHQAFLNSEFSGIFSGRQPRQDVKVFLPIGN